MIGNSNGETSFPYKLLLTNTKVLRLLKVFLNNSSVNIKLSKTYLSEIRQSGRFFGTFPELLFKTDLPFMKNLLNLSAESVLIPVRLIASPSATDAAIQNEIFQSGMTKIIISNKKMD